MPRSSIYQRSLSESNEELRCYVLYWSFFGNCLYLITEINLFIFLRGKQVYTVATEVQSYFVIICIFILLSRESDQCVMQARLRVSNHLSITPR